MHIVNRTGDVVTVKTFKNDDSLKYAHISYEYVHPDQHLEQNQGWDSVVMWVWPGEITPGEFTVTGGMLPPAHISDVCSNRESHIIRKDGASFKIVHWSQVLRKWQKQAASLSDDELGNNETLNQGLDAGMILLSGLATGVAAIGKSGALPAGVIMGLGNLILFALMPKDEEVPPPPNLDEITSAIRKVIKEEIDINEAELAGTNFEEIQSWLFGLGRLAHSQLRGQGVGSSLEDLAPHDKADAMNKIEKIISGEIPFSANLAHMNHHREIARSILPAYISGIGASLQIRRLHEWIRRMDGSKITDETLKDYLLHVKECRQGLVNAKTAFEKHLEESLEKDGTHDIPEADLLTKIYTRTRTGHENLSFVDEAINKLNEIEKNISADIDLLEKGRSPQHFWREEWFESPASQAV